MACTSLTALPRVCPEGVLAGIEKVYVIAYKDLAPLEDSTEIYTLTEGDIVSQIGLADAKTYVEIGLLKSTTGLKETLTKNAQNGTSFWTQEMTLVLSDLTVENKTFVKAIQNQPVSALLKTRTGKWFVTGLNGQFEVSAAEGGTGTAEADLIGYTITFQGLSISTAFLVDEALIPDLIATP